MKKCTISRFSDECHPANGSSSCPQFEADTAASYVTNDDTTATSMRRTKSSDNLTLDNSDNAVVFQQLPAPSGETTVKHDFHSSFFQITKSPSPVPKVEKQEPELNCSFEGQNETQAVQNDSEEQIEDEDDATYEDFDNGDDSSSDDDSNVSEFSGLSNISDEDSNRLLNPWLHRQIVAGVDPRQLLSKIIGNTDSIPPDVSDLTLWRIIANSLAQPRRKKLINTTTINDVCNLLRTSKNIIVLTGAGVSVSCGIPDFRSRDGIYARLAVEYPDLPDPQAMFDIRYFSQDPRPFFKFAREIYPGQFQPSPVHRFIRKLEERGQLLRNYTQNIDTLENIAGIKNVIECHGSFASASCTKCKAQVTAAAIEKDVFEQRIPLCTVCNPNAVSPKSCELRTQDPTLLQQLVANGIMKPDIVFFGEGLPELFHNTIDADRAKCDLLIVIGSSLKVRPVALIPSWISAQVPQILINREPLHHLDFDINLLGDSDVIVNQLCHMLDEDWTSCCWNPTVLTEVPEISYTTEPKFTPPPVDQLPELDVVGDIAALATDSVTVHTVEPSVSDNSNSLVLTQTQAAQTAATSITTNNKHATEVSEDSIVEVKRRRIHLPTLSPNSSMSEQSETFGGQAVPAVQTLRHDSVDSAKDSGIEDSTTTHSAILTMSGDSSCPATTPSVEEPAGHPTTEVVQRTISSCDDDDDSDDSFGEDKSKPSEGSSNTSSPHKDNPWHHHLNRVSLASNLPENSFCRLANRNYIFAGAEVFVNDLERFSDDRNIHSNSLF